MPFLPADERYLELAHRNGDTCFYHPTYSLWYMDRGAWADNFRSLSIVSDADWDDNHPAGTPLDDLFEVSFAVYGPYIRNGYIYRRSGFQPLLLYLDHEADGST